MKCNYFVLWWQMMLMKIKNGKLGHILATETTRMLTSVELHPFRNMKELSVVFNQINQDSAGSTWGLDVVFSVNRHKEQNAVVVRSDQVIHTQTCIVHNSSSLANIGLNSPGLLQMSSDFRLPVELKHVDFPWTRILVTRWMFASWLCLLGVDHVRTGDKKATC